MIKISNSIQKFLMTLCHCGLFASYASAHPHVFVEASVEIVRNDEGEFSELRQVWRFDELFSATLLLDFDKNADGKLDESEIKEITTVVAKSIAEYDFYTALRLGEAVVEFYPPEELNGYVENGQMIMFLSVEPVKPHSITAAPLRVSASDTSYYVAFQMKPENVKITGPNSEACAAEVTHPDFDKLYAENEKTLNDAFLEDQENNNLNLGDEFYSWAKISCS